MRTDLNISDPDAFYELLLDAHSTLTEEQSADFDARLLLLLANHIGDQAVLAKYITAARVGVLDYPDHKPVSP